MNVDNPAWIRVHHVIGQYLHVAREHDEINIVVFEPGANLALCSIFVCSFDGNQKKRNAVEIRNSLTVGVIGYYAWNFAGQFATLMAIKQVNQAMVVL